MNLVRALLFDNLGLKLVALLLAVLVYLNVYTDRPASMIVSFPIQVTDLADSLTLAGPAPGVVRVELRGPAKQLIRLRLSEPPVKVSVAGMGRGHFERVLGIADLPLPEGVGTEVDRMVSPRTLSLELDLKGRHWVPVAARIQGEPAGGFLWDGAVRATPGTVEVEGPRQALAALDSVRLKTVTLVGRRDTVRIAVGPQSLPEWCTMTPGEVELEIAVEAAVTRRLVIPVESPPGAAGLAVTPSHVTAVVTAPRGGYDPDAVSRMSAYWVLPTGGSWGGRRLPVRHRGGLPAHVRVRFEPDSVTVQRVGR
ncbi:MAG TPA: YbbR-like domain-containing protein [Candidatus Eisenbacteria bacterium]|jgi:hypothetical protein